METDNHENSIASSAIGRWPEINRILGILRHCIQDKHERQELSITADPTVSDPAQGAQPPEPEGTFRAELLGQLYAAQNQLEAQISELRRVAADPGLIAECSTQLGFLSNLRENIATATPATMASMRAEIAASMEAVAGIAQQARIAANDAVLGAAQLAATSAATRREVAALSTDLFERRIFDPYLHFDSKEDEEAYRRREAEGRRYIEQQLAAKTPEGDLNAAGGTVDRMLDAHAHGAGDSPEFLPRWNRLIETTNKQRDALRHEGRSTEEFDRNINASVRRFLKAKGLSDEAIDAALAASANPLDAVKPYIDKQADAQALEQKINLAAQIEPSQPVTTTVAMDSPGTTQATLQERAAVPTGLDDVMAKLRSAGVTSSEPDAANKEFAHGVTQQIRSAPDGGRGSP